VTIAPWPLYVVHTEIGAVWEARALSTMLLRTMRGKLFVRISFGAGSCPLITNTHDTFWYPGPSLFAYSPGLATYSNLHNY
jgi:hypothetical protein